MAADTVANIEFIVPVDGHDIVLGLNNNDELILSFIIDMLERADSSELRERLADRLKTWDEEHSK